MRLVRSSNVCFCLLPMLVCLTTTDNNRRYSDVSIDHDYLVNTTAFHSKLFMKTNWRCPTKGENWLEAHSNALWVREKKSLVRTINTIFFSARVLIRRSYPKFDCFD
jgi:hypothetical protein